MLIIVTVTIKQIRKDSALSECNAINSLDTVVILASHSFATRHAVLWVRLNERQPLAEIAKTATAAYTCFESGLRNNYQQKQYIVPHRYAQQKMWPRLLSPMFSGLCVCVSVCLSVCLCVCLLVTTVSHTKTGKPIKVRLGV